MVVGISNGPTLYTFVVGVSLVLQSSSQSDYRGGKDLQDSARVDYKKEEKKKRY